MSLIIFFFFLFFLIFISAIPTAYGSFWSRNQTQATTMTIVTTAMMPSPSPTEPPGNSYWSFLNIFMQHFMYFHLEVTTTADRIQKDAKG